MRAACARGRPARARRSARAATASSPTEPAPASCGTALRPTPPSTAPRSALRVRVSSEPRFRVRLAVVVAILAILAGGRERAEAVWSTQGPHGGDVTALALAPG